MDIYSLIVMGAAYIYELFFVIALFLIHIKFKTIETYIMFYSLFLTNVMTYSATIFMQGPEAVYSDSGEIISMIQPSQIFEYSMYVSSFTSLIVYPAFLIFAIQLYRDKL